MIRMENVSFHYADCEQGVKDINLTIHDGECVVLTGPSGGGKTTLTRLLNGLAPAYYTGSMEGHIFSRRYTSGNAAAICRRPPGGQRIPGSQKPVLFFRAGRRGGPLPVRITGWPGRRSAAGPAPPSELFPWSICGGRSLDVLSSGEKQRVAIASVYALRPGVYVCDEPTANLDGEGARAAGRSPEKTQGRGLHPGDRRAPAGMALRHRRPFPVSRRRTYPVGEKPGGDGAHERRGTGNLRPAGGSDAVAFPGCCLQPDMRRCFYPGQRACPAKERAIVIFSPSLPFSSAPGRLPL